jgi:serine/threonine-protein kinase
MGQFQFERRNQEGYQQAQELFQRAMDIDPEFAPAYLGLAHTFGSAAIFGMRRPADSMPRARNLAQQAIRLDDTLADAHIILAGVSFYWDWDWAQAESTARRALDFNPNSAHLFRFISEVFSVTGRHEEALAAVERGRELDPLSPISQFKPSLILYLKGDYDAAIDRAETALGFYPEFWQGHWLLCLSRSAKGAHGDAVAACEEAARYSGGTPIALGALGSAYARAGNRDAARRVLSELRLLQTRRYVGPSNIAVIHGALGNLDAAFGELEKAYRERDLSLIHSENAALFETLRSDRRFAALRNASGRGRQGNFGDSVIGKIL